MTQIPIFLCKEQDCNAIGHWIATVKQDKYLPCSVRDLILTVHNVKRRADKACVLLLSVRDEVFLQTILPYLLEIDVPLALVVWEPLSAGMCDYLLAVPHLTVLPAYLPTGENDLQAVFCKRADPSTLRMLRKDGVRTVITAERSVAVEIPFGMDVLYTSDLPSTKRLYRESSRSIELPLDAEPLFSAPHLAVPLSILGASRQALHRALACGKWSARYMPDEERYVLTSEFSALQTVCDEVPQPACEAFCSYLHDGWYIELQTFPHTSKQSGCAHILLHGYDAEKGVFAALIAMPNGLVKHVSLAEQTVCTLCNRGGTKMMLHRLSAAEQVCTTEDFVRELQAEQAHSADGKCVFGGREAAVRYANGFCRRLLDETELSADSLRTFLEERRRFGFALWYHAKHADLYLEPYESYLHMLASLCKPAINELRGVWLLKPDMPLCMTADLLQKLLSTEESCVTAFLEEWERLAFRRDFLNTEKAHSSK